LIFITIHFPCSFRLSDDLKREEEERIEDVTQLEEVGRKANREASARAEMCGRWEKHVSKLEKLISSSKEIKEFLPVRPSSLLSSSALFSPSLMMEEVGERFNEDDEESDLISKSSVDEGKISFSGEEEERMSFKSLPSSKVEEDDELLMTTDPHEDDGSSLLDSSQALSLELEAFGNISSSHPTSRAPSTTTTDDEEEEVNIMRASFQPKLQDNDNQKEKQLEDHIKDVGDLSSDEDSVFDLSSSDDDE